MGWHGLPSPEVVSRVSDGVKMAIAVFGAAVMMTIVIVMVIVLVIIVADVLSRPAGGCEYRKHGPLWRRRYRAVPARDHDGEGILTVREEQLWGDLAARYDTPPLTRGGAEVHDRRFPYAGAARGGQGNDLRRLSKSSLKCSPEEPIAGSAW
jgi:hypothetical protein